MATDIRCLHTKYIHMNVYSIMDSYNMKTKITNAYSYFFNELQINPTTGEFLNTDTNTKFATYPFLGSNYEKSKLKIVVVGLDIGKDETNGCIQSFEHRFG